VAGTLGGILAVASVVGVLIAPLIVLICAPGFRLKQGDQFGLAVEMLRWTFPYLLFVSMTALAGGVLNSYQKFALPAFTSVLLNVVMIIFATLISPHFERPVVALAVGVFVGGMLQVVMQIPALLKLGVLRRPRWKPQHEAVRRIARLMGPAILGSSMGQLSIMVSSGIASMFADGSISWLYFADRLVEFPLGVFSIALGTVILPSLSGHHARSAPEEFSATLDWAIRLVCLIVIPASVALFVIAGPLTAAMYYRHEFTAVDVQMTQTALMAFSSALLGWSLIKVLAPGYYARQDTASPVRMAIRALAVTMVLNIALLVTLWVTGTVHARGMHAWLALTNGVGAICNAAMLFRGLVVSRVLRPQRDGWVLVLKIIVASAAMAAFLFWRRGELDAWLSAAVVYRLVWLAGLVAGGGGVYFATLWILGVRASQFRLQPPEPVQSPNQL
jgi:putative peptidoglycan lipid II flippase